MEEDFTPWGVRKWWGLLRTFINNVRKGRRDYNEISSIAFRSSLAASSSI
jgi:hypothetical protein